MKRKLEAQVLELLARRGSLHIGSIVELSDAHPYQVEECCLRLFHRGKITTDSCGVYRLASDGNGDRRASVGRAESERTAGPGSRNGSRPRVPGGD